jgi:YbbR domain-containing protein
MSLASRLAEHWQLKLLSLVFAVALWVFLVVEDKGEAIYTVPLGTEAVAVRVHGLRHVLNRLDERELHAAVNLGGIPPGDVLVRIRVEDITVPPGVEVVRIIPPRVRATLEPVAAPSRSRP